MKTVIFILAVLMVAMAIGQTNQLTVADQIVKLALDEQTGYKWLAEVCAIGPRLSGSPNSYKAYDWAEQKMNQLGLDKVWRQEVSVPHWVRGNVEKAEIAGTGKALSICALGGSIGTTGITAEVIEVQSFDELHSRAKEAKGKIVFFNRPFDNTLLNTFRAYGGAVGQRGSGAIEAAKVGGVAALVRSVTSKGDNVPHTGVMRYDDTVKKVPAAAVGIQDADHLSAALKSDPQLKVSLALSAQSRPDTLGYNIIGEIRGSEFPDEVIVVGGHFGSWDKGQGAHDDGGGSMQSLEVLSLIKRLDLKPKRTIRCVLFIDEEMTQSGAKTYAARAAAYGEKHLAAIESDRGVFTPRGFSVDADSVIREKINSWLPALQKAGIDWVKKGHSGVDVGKIENVTAKIGYVPDGQRYFDFHHSDNDVYAAVHPREMQLGTAAMAILVWQISEEGL